MKQSEPFIAIASKIERNGEEAFGGAIVIVPPSGEPSWSWVNEMTPADIGLFWAAVKTKVDNMIAQLDERQRNQQAFRMR
jgi:hypothetical protein